MFENTLSLNIIGFISTIIKSISSNIIYFIKLTSNKELILPVLILSCSSCIGISSLTLPGSVEQTGVLLWPILLFLTAFINYFSNKLLAKVAFILDAKTYSEVCEKVLGDMKLIPDCLTLVSNFCLIISCNLTWVTFVENLVFIIFSKHSTKLMMILYMIIPNFLLIPTLLKNKIQDVAVPAAVSIIAVLFLLLFVVSTFSAKVYNYAFSDSEEILFSYSKITLADISMIPRSLCLLLFSFSYQQNIIDVSQDLSNKIYRKEEHTTIKSSNEAEKSSDQNEINTNHEDTVSIKIGSESSLDEKDSDNSEIRSRENSENNNHKQEIYDQDKILKDQLMTKMIHTILKMENFFKAFLFLCIGMFGFFSFCQRADLLDANILSLYQEQSSLVVYVNLFMAVCVLITAIFVFKPTKDTLIELISFINSDVKKDLINKYCTFGLQLFIMFVSALLVLEKVSFIKLISIISFYISPLVGIYFPVFLYAKLTGEIKYYVISGSLIIVALLTIWI